MCTEAPGAPWARVSYVKTHVLIVWDLVCGLIWTRVDSPHIWKKPLYVIVTYYKILTLTWTIPEKKARIWLFWIHGWFDPDLLRHCLFFSTLFGMSRLSFTIVATMKYKAMIQDFILVLEVAKSRKVCCFHVPPLLLHLDNCLSHTRAKYMYQNAIYHTSFAEFCFQSASDHNINSIKKSTTAKVFALKVKSNFFFLFFKKTLQKEETRFLLWKVFLVFQRSRMYWVVCLAK